MNDLEGAIFEFGEFRIDVSERSLVRKGEPISITPKVFDLLVLLVANRGKLLDKSYILDTLWKDSFVEEANLNVNISALRRALGENRNENKYVETVPKRGYRFVCEVIEIGKQKGDEAPAVVAPVARTQNKAVFWVTIGTIAFVAALGLAAVLIFRQPVENKGSISGIRSIGVLPFRPLVSGTEDEALQIGMADALITKLSVLENLTVRPTSAVTKYKDNKVEALTAGRELQVDAVLDGKIQRSDNKIRVTVQLVRVVDGETLWAGSFDDYFTNIFAVQDSISERMLSSISRKISGQEKSLLTKRQTESTEAYMLYLQARYFHEQISEEGSKKALIYYRAAIQKDPEYALAYASMTGALLHMVNLNIERETNLQAARDSAAKAAEIDPDLAEAHEALATIKQALDWDFAGAEREYKKALELNPQSSDVHYSYSMLLSVAGRHDEAIHEVKQSRQLNPTAQFIQLEVALTFYRARRYDDALSEIRRAVEMEPENNAARSQLVRILIRKGEIDEARKEVGWTGFSDRGRLLLGAEIDLLTEMRPEGLRVIRKYLADFDKELSNYNAAQYYVEIGEYDKAVEKLEIALKQRDPIITMIATDPILDPIRNDPRFINILRQVNIAAN